VAVEIDNLYTANFQPRNGSTITLSLQDFIHNGMYPKDHLFKRRSLSHASDVILQEHRVPIDFDSVKNMSS